MSKLTITLVIVVLLGLYSECNAVSYKDLIAEYNKFTSTLQVCDEFSYARVMHKLVRNTEVGNEQLRRYLLQKTPENLYQQLLDFMGTCRDRSPVRLTFLMAPSVFNAGKDLLIKLAPYIKGCDDTLNLHLPSNEGLTSIYPAITTKEQLCEEYLQGKSAIALLKKDKPTKMSALIGEDWKHSYVPEFERIEKKCQSDSALNYIEMEDGRYWLTSAIPRLSGFEEYVRS